MKKIIFLTLFSIIIAAADCTKSMARTKQTKVKNKPQKASSKKEKEVSKKKHSTLKEWGQRKKHLQPLQLKEIIEENHRLKQANLALHSDRQQLEIQLKQTTEQYVLQHKANEAIRDLSELPQGSYTVNKNTGQVLIGGIVDTRYGVDPLTGLPFIKGIIFKVQIGANKDLNLKEVLTDEVHHETLEQEKDSGLYKYTIGHFKNYWEADKLKKGLRNMGIQFAWIVPYKDGKRVLLKDVLHNITHKKE